MKLLIFDFDGTIVDSKNVYYHSISSSLLEYGFSRKQVEKFIGSGLSISETLKKMGFRFLFRLFLKRKIMNDVLKKVNEVKKCRDADSLVNIPAEKILVSNSLKEFILPVLKHLGIRSEFSKIYGADDFDNKQKFISEYIRKNKLDKKNVFYVGDRIADIKLARKIGIKSIIISGKCSWSSRKEILSQKPDFVFFNLKNIADMDN